jgi:class 3 adenylate cyclase/tetratricopeptide (TPR) repeat protein
MSGRSRRERLLGTLVGRMDREQLEAAIAAQEALRGIAPDEVIDVAIAALRAQLEAGAPSRRRRLVTVLFADLSGFTSMSETMDAEEVSTLMEGLWARLDAVVVAHGARIDKHMGDALMALWGADTTLEDDAERAVRAGLELHEALAEFRSATGAPLALRIGVNTGPVMLGSVGTTGEFSVIGDAVNVASRLEHAAPVGGTLLSHDTYRHVRGVFDVNPQDPLHVRGKAAPLQTYLVMAAKPRAFRLPTRGVEGTETKMVGRQRELDALRRALVGVESSDSAWSVAVVGEAGLGKSRLLWEFEDWLELREQVVYLLTGRALASRQGVPMALLRDIMANRLQIADDDPASSVLAKLVAGTGDAMDAADAAMLGRWLGFDLHRTDGAEVPVDGEALRRAGRLLLERFVRKLAADAPVVLLVEDLHWADEGSLAVLGELMDTLADARWLAVLTTRSTDPSHRAVDVVERVDDRLDLTPLSDGDAAELVHEILHRVDHVPSGFVEGVVRRGEGNAFFLEELVKMLIDDGSIVIADHGWTIRSDALALGDVPATLTGVLQARLDALSSADRRLLQLASILGRVFWDRAVERLAGGLTTVSFGDLVNREFVFPRSPSTFSACSEFTFKHALLHDVTYETVLLADRRILHAGAAVWLEEMAGERLDEFLVEIAEHHRLAGAQEAAADRLASACHLALRVDPLACRRLGEQAVRLYVATGMEPPARLITDLARAYLHLGDLAAASDAAQRAVAQARRSVDESILCEALRAEAHALELAGDLTGADSRLNEAQALAERVGGTVLGEVLILVGWNKLRAGRACDGVQTVERVLEIAEQCDEPSFVIRSHLLAASFSDDTGDYDTSVRHHEAGLEISRRIGDRWGELLTLNNLGATMHLWGTPREITSTMSSPNGATGRPSRWPTSCTWGCNPPCPT